MKRYAGIFTVLVLFLVLFSHSHPLKAAAPFPTNGWEISTPEAQGMDSQALLAVLEGNSDFHTILAIRHGSVVLDASQYPFTGTQPHALYGITRGFVTTLIGIAIDKGYIKSVDQSIWDFFSKEQTANMDARKEALTIEHLLTYTSGLLVDDMGIYRLTANDPSWVQFVLDSPMQQAPGTSYQYRDANAHLASALISAATGMSADEFARQVLFAPLGITDATWSGDPQGISQGADHLFMSPNSMAKLGYLYLRQGEWDGQQIVAADWTTRAVSHLVQEPTALDAVGYFWFAGLIPGTPYHGYAAAGYRGETLWVLPELDLVVVTTNDLGLNFMNGQTKIITMIASAVTSEEALPENPDGLAALQAYVDLLAHPVARKGMPIPPALIDAISGKVYQLDRNNEGWLSLAITFPQDGEALLTIGLQDKELKLPVGLDNVYRVSTGGLPAEPAWRPVADVPLMLKGGALGPRLLITVEDSLGLDLYTLTLSFSSDGSRVGLTLNSAAQGIDTPLLLIDVEGKAL